MRIRTQNDLLLINIITVLLIIVITVLPSSALRIILGLPFILFLPGYALISAVFLRKNQLRGLERLALSFGLSIVVVPISGFILNYTPWGITLYSVLISVAIFIFVASLIAWYRRRSLAESERFSISLTFNLASWKSQGLPDKILSVILIVTMLGAIGTLGYVFAAPKVGERFTEFYILGPEGKAEDYPKELVVGEEGRVIMGIINREHETVSYRMEVTIDGTRHGEIGPVVVLHDGRWEREVGFMPLLPGDNQKVEFLLYRQGQSEAYRSIHLWINVKKQD